MTPEETPAEVLRELGEREQRARQERREAVLRIAEQEAERLSAVMGPEWAAGMYD